MSVLLEFPAGGGLDEVFSVLVLAEGYSGSDAEDGAAAGFKYRQDFAAVLSVIGNGQLFPDVAIVNLLGRTLDDYGFVGFFRADDAARIGSDVLGFASARSGAEPEGVFPPNAPDDHEVRAVRARGHFPSDDAATKLLFLVLNRSEKEWIMPPREWAMAKSQFAVLFGERFTMALA